MDNTSLGQWLERLETLHPTEIELGLDRVSTVAGALDLLSPSQPVVTVAGTNGKGSTVAVLDALLEQCGQVAGTYTSPHLLRFNERIRVGGEEAGDSELVSAFGEIERARGDISLTYFEFTTLAALLLFRERCPDVLLLEVGLGGRLDAVNIVDPTVSVITSIDMDHENWLGADRASIALEKAGIMRRGRPVVIAEPDPPAELLRRAREVGASPVLRMGREFEVLRRGDCWSCAWRGPAGAMRETAPRPVGPLLPENVCAALQAAALLGVDVTEEHLGRALEKAPPVGRRQSRRVGGRDYLLDVAHNPASVEKLVEVMRLSPCKKRNIALFSAMSDKDLKGMIHAAAGQFDAWFLADRPDLPRAAPAAAVADLLRDQGVVPGVSGDLRQAFQRALASMEEGDRLVVFGSFFTVAGVLPLLDGEAGNA